MDRLCIASSEKEGTKTPNLWTLNKGNYCFSELTDDCELRIADFGKCRALGAGCRASAAEWRLTAEGGGCPQYRLEHSSPLRVRVTDTATKSHQATQLGCGQRQRQRQNSETWRDGRGSRDAARHLRQFTNLLTANIPFICISYSSNPPFGQAW